MNDSWNVKSMRYSGHYQSCMKINGERLLPPVLSKECRKEMQYYKMLAQEVEKRISILQLYLTDGTANSAQNDATDAPEASDYKHIYDVPPQDISRYRYTPESPERSPITKDKGIECVKVTTDAHSNNFVIDLSLRIKHQETKEADVKYSPGGVTVSQTSLEPIDLPERDCDSLKTARTQQLEKQFIDQLFKDCGAKPKKELLLDFDICPGINKVQAVSAKKELTEETINYKFDLNKDSLSDVFLDITQDDSPPSASSKSFTGSLLDIQSEFAKESEFVSKLLRQRSYTVLHPSPQLMAHLEIQSKNKGVALTSISMSESVSNGNQKKRRSWDLETAKQEWSSMALELKQTNVRKPTAVNANNETRNLKRNSGSPTRKSQSVVPAQKGLGLYNRNLTNSDPIHQATNGHRLTTAPSDRSITIITSARKAMIKDCNTPTNTNNILKIDSALQNITPVITDSENPALKIRELYEKLKTQQVMQMNSLIEKQHKEQLFLQKVFEEQNNILFKQLKMICPKSPIEVRQAWSDEKEDPDAGSGPVSLSQLNNIQKALPSAPGSPISKTLTDTKHYISHCENVLKVSRDITNSIKKPKRPDTPTSPNNSNKRAISPLSRDRSRSLNVKNTSRKLNYESASDYEPILTDRTNDTLADLNVTFPSDSEDSKSIPNNGTQRTMESAKQLTLVRRSPAERIISSNKTDAAIKCLEKTIQNSINTMSAQNAANHHITPEELAAASTIVAYAKGYLVRRLMETDRVQATVQTIRDALLCALQLHQDREGIRGADVDLHRRLIQQITAACYSLHDTFITTTPKERCALIAADRAKRRAASLRQGFRQTDIMSRSHSGVFPARSKRPSSAASLMTQSTYETFSGSTTRTRRRPWR